MNLKASVRFGVTVGLALAVVVAVFFATWDWLENPGGIFRGEAGTNWSFVWDTAFSWFLPMVVPCIVAAVGLHALWVSLRRGGARETR